MMYITQEKDGVMFIREQIDEDGIYMRVVAPNRGDVHPSRARALLESILILADVPYTFVE